MDSWSTILGVFLVPLGGACAWHGWKQLDSAAGIGLVTIGVVQVL